MVSAKVWSEDILLPIDSPDCFVVEHRIERIPRVAVLLVHSIPELAPLVNKHVT